MSLPSFPERALHWLEARPALRRLDRVPFGRALVLGLLLGLLAGVAILGLPGGARVAVAATVIAVAAAVAWSAQPVGIWEAVEESEPLLDMVAVEGGSFLMGSPDGEPGRLDNETQHRVAVSAFRLARSTVTRVQYREVMELDEADPGGNDHPVTEVSWFDAVAFCNRLSELEELPPCYGIEGQKVAWISDAGGYRLPTETEWEYAARAGSARRWPFWRLSLRRYAWFSENSGVQLHPVATRRQNPWGLHDMHGNVWEWCWDVHSAYPTEPVEIPAGPGDSPGASRVIRGGAFDRGARSLRSAARNWVVPAASVGNIGFRCARSANRRP